MSGRARLGAGILAVWVITLGWHIKREYLRPLDEVIASGARTLPPGTAYYAVYRARQAVGWARSEVDTLPGGEGFLLEDRLEAVLPELGSSGILALQTRAELGPTLGLRRFAAETRGALGSFSVQGEVVGDTLLRLRSVREGVADSTQVALERPVVLSSALAMRLAAQGRLNTGDRLRLPVLDPLSASARPTELVVLDARRRTYPDSATTDAVGRWVPAREDTVQAWLIARETGGVELRSWIDEDGRLLEAVLPLGLRLERTAFELAYYPYRDRIRPGVRPDAGEGERR